jgi:type VI secretion system protein ImpF
MARDTQPGLTPSLLDRFLDPAFQRGDPLRGFSLSEMADAVRRDLEELLNTRRSDHRVPESCVEVRRSLIAFGLPDLTTLNATSPGQREEIGVKLAQIIELFEPRLKEVQAKLVEVEADRKQRSIRYRIDARLSVEPAPEVAFETVLELASGRSSVTRADS